MLNDQMLWAAFLVWRRRLPQRTLIGAALALLSAAPWTVRNSLVSRSFVPLAVGNGQVLVGADNNTVLTEQNSLGLWIRSGASGLRITIPPCQDDTACEVLIRRLSTATSQTRKKALRQAGKASSHIHSQPGGVPSS